MFLMISPYSVDVANVSWYMTAPVAVKREQISVK